MWSRCKALCSTPFKRQTYRYLATMLCAERGFWRPSFWSSIRLARESCRHGAYQKPTELAALLALLAPRRPQTVLEIGSGAGGTLHAWCGVAAPDATVVSVDLPDGPFGGRSLESAERSRQYARREQRLRLLPLDSHDPATPDEVRDCLNGGPVEFLFIDGDHTYEGVKQDFETYALLVNEGGLIALHDITHHPEVPDCEVDRFWRELRARGFRTLEIVDPGDVRSFGPWAGIGVVFWPGGMPV